MNLIIPFYMIVTVIAFGGAMIHANECPNPPPPIFYIVYSIIWPVILFVYAALTLDESFRKHLGMKND